MGRLGIALVALSLVAFALVGCGLNQGPRPVAQPATSTRPLSGTEAAAKAEGAADNIRLGDMQSQLTQIDRDLGGAQMPGDSDFSEIGTDLD